MINLEIPKFVKWAGGKGQLIEQFKPLFPKKIDRYFEPFVGSGAVAFYIIQKYKPKEVFLSDTNEELINAYQVIKTDVESLILKLKEHKKDYYSRDGKYYYEIRALDPKKLSKVDNAARFIFLNKTCFNGLYRANSKGGFNVPIGSYKNPEIFQEDKLRRISKLLKDVSINIMPFEKILPLTKKGDFIYLDPPYYPLKKNSFTTYQKNVFLDDEHKKLAALFEKLDKKGCLVMESNSDADFVKNLYSNYSIQHVKARRAINCRSEGRGIINEIVIKNY